MQNINVYHSVGYEHRSLKNPLGSLENLPARRALVLEMLEKNFARFSLGSVCARKKLRSSSLGLSTCFCLNRQFVCGIASRRASVYCLYLVTLLVPRGVSQFSGVLGYSFAKFFSPQRIFDVHDAMFCT